MNTFLAILLVVAMAATAYVLVRGVIAMANGKDVTAELFQALNDEGWTIPAGGACYWVGEAMHKTDFKDLEKVPDPVMQSARMVASNAAHLAYLLKERTYPGVPKEKGGKQQ